MSREKENHSSGTSDVPRDANIGAQELLAQDIDYHGFIRKRGQKERFFEHFKFAKALISGLLRWRQRFVIVSKGYMYVFDNENASKPLQCVHLEGYNRMYLMASEHSQWAFRLESIYIHAKLHYFSCINDDHRKEWMQKIRNGMCEANGQAKERPPINEDIYQYLVKPVFEKAEENSENSENSENADDDDNESDDGEGSMDSDYCQINEEELAGMAIKKKPTIPLPAIPTDDDPRGAQVKTKTAKKGKTSKNKDQHDYINSPDKKVQTLPSKVSPVTPAVFKPDQSVAGKAKTLPTKKHTPSESEYMLNDSDRTKALEILRDNPKGTYLVRLSRNQPGKVLAVQTDENVKEYRIFEKGNQLTLNNKEYFKSMEDLLSNYQGKNLPNRNISLARAFSQNDVRF